MARALAGIAVNVGDRREVLLYHRFRQRAEGREQFDSGLLIGFGLEIIAAGFKPGFVGLRFALFRAL